MYGLPSLGDSEFVGRSSNLLDDLKWSISPIIELLGTVNPPTDTKYSGSRILCLATDTLHLFTQRALDNLDILLIKSIRIMDSIEITHTLYMFHRYFYHILRTLSMSPGVYSDPSKNVRTKESSERTRNQVSRNRSKKE